MLSLTRPSAIAKQTGERNAYRKQLSTECKYNKELKTLPLSQFTKIDNLKPCSSVEERKPIETEEDGEGVNLLRNVSGSFLVLAVHGQGPCLDRSSTGRKEREVGEGSRDQKSERRIIAGAGQPEGFPCMNMIHT
ncbi:hypothetical protein K1719_014967 [Acacia pycnantha]|nr:hypothetical protein K1719_014967 [Acacia pycnantha]